MGKKPFFSIVIPTYNRAVDLQFALFCIFRQSFTDFEVVISDNCSTDETKSVVNRLDDKKIRYSRIKKTVGNALNIRRSIKQAKGEYIFLHSDDDFLVYEDTLQKIYNEIIKHDFGYIRLNYMSLSIDRTQIFLYKVNKPFTKNVYIDPNLENKKIFSFIVDSDPYFITGIIFKNSLPRNIKIVDSDPVPWIEIIFYTVKNFGACFVAKPSIVASWSRRKIKKNERHHIFTLINGKLRSENYLNVVKQKLNSKEYSNFLHKELMLLYVTLFPVIKIHVGNGIMISMARRIRSIDPSMKRNVKYWLYLIGTLVVPRFFLTFIRPKILYLYAKLTKVDNNTNTKNMLRELEKKFLNSRENVLKQENPIFKF